tara:strand:- start:730 stop:1533 length:804 start_codon:yes stop_codon:yes gene_type:complete
MKHNKKRNTAFLYECLVKELTKAIIRNDNDLKIKITEVIKESFNKGTVLKKDLDIYNSLLEGTGQSEYAHALRVIYEIKKDYDSLDRKAVFNAQTKLIKKMNESFDSGIWNNFVSNYKNMATADMFFKQEKLPAKKRLLIEHRVVEFRRETLVESKMKHIDNLTYKTFVNKFNETYAESLRKEQRELLTNFIISFSDNGVGLKSFINEEIHRLRTSLQTLNEGSYAQNASKVVNKLNSFKERRLDEQMLRDLFYIQDLVHEVTKNEH